MKGSTRVGAVLIALLALLYTGSAEADGRTEAARVLMHYAVKAGEELPLHITAALVVKWLEDNVLPPKPGPQPSPEPKPLPSGGGTITRDDDARLTGLYSKLCTDKYFLARLDIDRRALEELGCQHRADLGFQVIAVSDENFRKLGLWDHAGVMVSAVNTPLLSTAEEARKLDETGKEEKENCRARGGSFCDISLTVLSDYPTNMLTDKLMVGDVISSMTLLKMNVVRSPDERGWCGGHSLYNRKFDVSNPTEFDGVRLFAYSGAEIFLPIQRIKDEGVRKEMIASLNHGIDPNFQQEAGAKPKWPLFVTCLVVQ